MGRRKGKYAISMRRGDIVGQDKGGHLWVVARESALSNET